MVCLNKTITSSLVFSTILSLFSSVTFSKFSYLPPVLLRADGQVERLGVTAPVVGLFDTPWECATGETVLAAGDTLVIFTDGVSEANSDEGDEFGEERLIALLHRHAGLPAQALLDAIVAAVGQHSAAEQFDDLTLIVARVR